MLYLSLIGVPIKLSTREPTIILYTYNNLKLITHFQRINTLYLQEEIVSGIKVGLVNSSAAGIVFLIVSFFLNFDAKFENVPPKMEEPYLLCFGGADIWRLPELFEFSCLD